MIVNKNEINNTIVGKFVFIVVYLKINNKITNKTIPKVI